MSVLFVSYGRRDASLARELHRDLEQANHDVWLDHDLEGGQQWWDEILKQLVHCHQLVFVLSPDSLRSDACLAELSYAVALGKSILPVMVREVNMDLAPDAIGSTQIVDYRERTPESMAELILGAAQARSNRLPDPLPAPPAAPIADTGPLRDRLALKHLDVDDQARLLAELKRLADNPDHHSTLLELAEQLRDRRDFPRSLESELDAVISSIPVVDLTDDSVVPTIRPLSRRAPDTLDRLRSLVTHIDKGVLTPIVGPGMADDLIGPLGLLSREWARDFQFPTDRRRSDDLPGAAQFIEVMTNADTLRSTLVEHVGSHVQQRHPGAAGTEPDSGLAQLLREAWKEQARGSASDPHSVLARFNCPIYIVAHPWDLMVEALRLQDKDPVVDRCRWRSDFYDWPPSALDARPDYVPSVKSPLVYHVFGTLDVPESLVLSEDDHFDFLINVTKEPSLIPRQVRRALADSALLLLGFDLANWGMRVLLRTLVSQEGGQKLQRYSHVAAQLDHKLGAPSPERERKYLERYFREHREPTIDIYWGSVAEFAADIHEIRGPR